MSKQFNKKKFMDFINQGKKCKQDCISHSLYTHNVCLNCAALKDSPYHKDYLQDKTDEEIADEIQKIYKEFED